MSSALLAPPLAPVMKPPHQETSAFSDLDDAVLGARPGALVVTVRDAQRDALLSHVARRLRAAGYFVVDILRESTTSLFREAATQLGIGALPCSISAYASAIANASPRLAILAPLPNDGTWDAAVAREIVDCGRTVLVLSTSADAPSWASSSFDVTPEFGKSDKLRWLAAVVHTSEALVDEHDLAGLDSWWRRTRTALELGPRAAASVPSRDVVTLSPAAARALSLCLLARRSLPVAAFASAGIDARVLDELRLARVITPNDKALVVDHASEPTLVAAPPSPDLRVATAEVLLGEAFADDPWAFARAAALLLPVREAEANAAMDRAALAARDARISSEIDAAWFARVDASEGRHLALRLRGAERAIAENQPHDALRWCESVVAEDRHDPRVCLSTVRARMQLGDLVTARLVLERIRGSAVDDDLRAAISVERSEIGFLTGEHEAALDDARTAIATTTSARTQLGARSIVGKILLARGEWEAADAHFAEDTLAARAAGETSAELRARLNRGIALLSKGLLDEAHQIFLDVRDDGDKSGDHRASAFALSNLGVVAYRQRNYADALTYWEATLSQVEAHGTRNSMAHRLANLADLRLRLGLVDNAEHAILFGQRILSGNLTPIRATQFKLVSAQVALARGFSELARDEVQSAMVHARASGDVEYIGATAIVGARIALSDGDVRGAEEWLGTAATSAKTARSIAELALLRATLSRATGHPALAGAYEALALARDSAEDDLLIDVHTLISTCARDEGDLEASRAHCARAVAIRDRIAKSLPHDVRERFLAKPEMLSLARLRHSLDEIAPESEPASSRPPPSDSAASLEGPASQARPVELVGQDPRMRHLGVALRKAALSDATILIQGESGTGKELVARALHAASSRATGPLVVVNCAALVETLLLSELFGHEKGSFTGATSRRRGRFELADGGTLFLDEIGDISPRTQVALLRVLQERTFERIGGTTTIRSDVRVVCATHRDLRVMVARGQFREDLYYRIRGITLEVPPLRARPRDIPLLATHLLARIASEARRPKPKTLAPDAFELLSRHRWPGNVRELENVLRATAVFAEGETLTRSDLLEASDDLKRAEAPDDPIVVPEVKSAGDRPLTAAAYEHVRENRISLHDMKREIERACVTRALKDSNGSITRAAELLGMKRPRVSQLAKQYGLSATSSPEDES